MKRATLILGVAASLWFAATEVRGQEIHIPKLSIAELGPATFTDRKVYVVMKRDGKPLTNNDGPFELIVPGERRYSRWVRQVRALTIKIDQAN